MNLYDDLVMRMRANTRGLSLLTSDMMAVLPEEAEALERVNALVQSWSVDTRR